MKKQLPENVCAKCIHYMQHYVLCDGKYRWAYLGHCTRPGLKPRTPDAKVCELFEPRPQSQGDPFE